MKPKRLEPLFLLLADNQDRSEKVRKNMELLAEYSPKIIKAISWKGLSLDTRFICMPQTGERFRLGKQACWDSHIKALRYIVEHKLDWALLTEDDMVMKSDFTEWYFSQDIPENCDLVCQGGYYWNDNWVTTWCNLFPSWESTKRILDKLLSGRRKSVDMDIVKKIHRDTSFKVYIPDKPYFTRDGERHYSEVRGTITKR